MTCPRMVAVAKMRAPTASRFDNALELHLKPTVAIAIAPEKLVLASVQRAHEEIQVSVFVEIDPVAALDEGAAFSRPEQSANGRWTGPAKQVQVRLGSALDI